MNCLLTLVFFWSLAVVSYSAPLKRSTQNSDLIRNVEHAKSLIKKIISDVPALHDSCISTEGLSLEPSAEVKNLDYIMTVLAIPSAPKLIPLSETHTLEMCLSNVAEGIQLHQHLLQEVEGKLACSDSLAPFLADIRDLSTQVHQVQQLAQVTSTEPHRFSSGLSSRLQGDYQVQVATHRILQQLQSFGQDVFRALRHIVLQTPPSSR